MSNFWTKLKKPFFCLAPMEDVTDTVFRQIVIKAGKPDVFFTEFINVEALNSDGKDRVIHRLKFKKNEHPIVAQIWGYKPESYHKAVKLVKELGFDGVDINMACPLKKIIKNGACAGLIKKPELAHEIILAVKEAAGQFPVSVKTRIGFDRIETEEWIGFLLKTEIQALTIHGRTRKEMSNCPAHWNEIGKAVKIRNKVKSKTLIIGNGDIKSSDQGLKMVKKYGVDGIMIGRGIFHNLLVFNGGDFMNLPIKEKLNYALSHLKLFNKTWQKDKYFNLMKKFFKIYVSGFDEASQFRMKLMKAKTIDESKELIMNFLKEKFC